MFYQENFLDNQVVKNNATLSYFRRTDTAVSNFSNKSMEYKKRFFFENLKYSRREYDLGHIDKQIFNGYLGKFYRKLKNRTTKKEKMSLKYLHVYVTYKLALKI